MKTAPASFKNPHSTRSKLGRLAWGFAYWGLYRWTPPRRGMLIRRWILKMFGAKFGKSWLHPSTLIWAPWLLEVGDECFVDARCNLYNAFGISLQDRSIISFGTTLCTATHDYEDATYPLTGGKISIGSDCWITAECFIGPGITVPNGVVVGARSVVTKSPQEWTVVAGNPAREIRKRCLRNPAR